MKTPSLRHRAEAKLRGAPPPSLARSPARHAANTQKLLHELQVHQVELEMQNGELQAARDRTELALKRYTDLYDFAPIGHFSLDASSRILEVNRTGATLLEMPRSRLLQERFARFIAPASRAEFAGFVERIQSLPGNHVCQIAILTAGGHAFWGNVHGSRETPAPGVTAWCRVALSDITSLKQAEDAQRRLAALSAANQDLNQEIARRQAVQEALKRSEQHQTQLLRQSHTLQEQLRSLSHRILQAQEEERKRISRELHDDVSQTLVGIHVHLQTLSQETNLERTKLRRRIVRTQSLVEKAIHLVHEFARELRPPLLDDLGLTATLLSLLKDFIRRTGIQVQFTTFAQVEQLSSARRTVLYRVAQSALANIVSHAKASAVRVVLRKIPKAVCMEIVDDGVSFDVDRVLNARRFRRLGILGMRERVEMVGGTFEVLSKPGVGTTIRVQIPALLRNTSPSRRARPTETTHHRRPKTRAAAADIAPSQS